MTPWGWAVTPGNWLCSSMICSAICSETFWSTGMGW